MSSRVSDSPPNSSESLHGLKFGQKIYFEDVGAGAPAKLGSGSQASAEGKKVKSGGPATLQPPRCQVEGCKVDLTDAKAYYSRHKVCGPHSKTPIVIVAGLEQRFCQQCSRFHQLSEFDQGKRSCRRRLAGHNERRRKTPAGSLLSPHFGGFSTSIFETSKDFGKSGSFMMDFSSHAKLPARNRHRSPTLSCEWASGSRSGSAENLLPPWHAHPGSNSPSNLYLQGSAGPGIPSCFVGVSDDSVCAHSLLSSVSWDGQPSSMAQQAALLSPFPSHMWAHRDNESASGTSQQMATNLGLGQISPPVHSQFPDHLDYGGGRPYMEVEHPRAYDISSTQQINWPL